MNDFTKEELEEIAEMMRHARKQGVQTYHNLSYQVEKKALSMIDNYCDHTWDDAATNQFYCIKCQKHVNKI
jgi:Tfp pilus assembly ATPase PilU